MKILTEKDARKIYKRLAALRIISEKMIFDVDGMGKSIENIAEIAFMIGGMSGSTIVDELVSNYNREIEAAKNNKMK